MVDETPSESVVGMSLLGRLDEAEIETLIAAGRRRRFPRGATIFFDGDEGGEVFVVLEGQVKITVGALDGREVVLALRGPGDVIGELAALDDSPRSATGTLLSESELLVIRRTEFRRLVDERFGLTRALLDHVADRVRDAASRQLEFGVDDAMARVCRRIVELGERFGEMDEDGVLHIEAPLSQQEIADWCGVSRQAVVKALKSLRSLGWLETKGRRIMLIDRPSVENRAVTITGEI